MLGFVNGRSCAHKSKPRGLINILFIIPAFYAGFYYTYISLFSVYFCEIWYKGTKKYPHFNFLCKYTLCLCTFCTFLHFCGLALFFQITFAPEFSTVSKSLQR